MRNLGTAACGWLGSIPSPDADDPRPFLIPGVRVRFDAIGIKAVRAARQALSAAFVVDPDDNEAAGDAMSAELIARGIVNWQGVGDSDGNPVAVTPATVRLFVADPDLFEAADIVYVWPWVLRDREKNVSAPSPDGTLAGATAGNAIATSAATGDAMAGAKATTKPTRVRTARTSRAPKRAKACGT